MKIFVKNRPIFRCLKFLLLIIFPIFSAGVLIVGCNSINSNKASEASEIKEKNSSIINRTIKSNRLNPKDVSNAPDKYIHAVSEISGDPGEVVSFNCEHFLCDVQGTTSAAFIPFKLTVSLKPEFIEKARAAGQKIQALIYPRFLVETRENGKSQIKTETYLFRMGSRIHGRIYRAFELSPKNSYSVSTYHETRVNLISKNSSGNIVEIHNIEGTNALISDVQFGERYHHLYANEFDASPDLKKQLVQ